MLKRVKIVRIGRSEAQVFEREQRTGYDGIRLPSAVRVRYRGVDVEASTEKRAIARAIEIAGVRTRRGPAAGGRP